MKPSKGTQLYTITNFRFESDYLEEFVAFHLAAGVSHMFLYDQEGKPEDRAMLEKYVAIGKLTIIDWTHVDDKYWRPTKAWQANKNHLAYTDAAKRVQKTAADWLLKIDVDEFLMSTDQAKSIPSILEEINRNSDIQPIRSLRIPRFDFSASGHQTKPAGGVLQNYTWREENPSNYKDAASVNCLNSNQFCYSSHRWSYKMGPRLLYKKLDLLASPFPLRIHHYYTKSKEEYFQRQNISGGRTIIEERFEQIQQRCSAVEDRSLVNKAPKLDI